MPAGVGLHSQPSAMISSSSSSSSRVCGQQGLIKAARSTPLLTHCVTSCMSGDTQTTQCSALNPVSCTRCTLFGEAPSTDTHTQAAQATSGRPKHHMRPFPSKKSELHSTLAQHARNTLRGGPTTNQLIYLLLPQTSMAANLPGTAPIATKLHVKMNKTSVDGSHSASLMCCSTAQLQMFSKPCC
jgi:hypothetical protein